MLRGRNGDEVGARAEHVRRVPDRDVVFLHGRVACGKGLRGGCQVEVRGVAPGPEVDRVPVRVIQLGRGNPGEALVHQVVVAEERLGAGVLHNDGGCVRVHGRPWSDLTWDGVGRCGPGAVDDVGGAVKLPWMDRVWCGQGRCVGQRCGEGHRCGVTMVSASQRGRQHGGGRRRAVSKGLEVCRVEEGGQGCGVGGGVVRARPRHGRGR